MLQEIQLLSLIFFHYGFNTRGSRQPQFSEASPDSSLMGIPGPHSPREIGSAQVGRLIIVQRHPNDGVRFCSGDAAIQIPCFDEIWRQLVNSDQRTNLAKFSTSANTLLKSVSDSMAYWDFTAPIQSQRIKIDELLLKRSFFSCQHIVYYSITRLQFPKTSWVVLIV